MKVLGQTSIQNKKGLWSIFLRFEPRDLWIGLFFKAWRPLDVYIILIPMLAIHITYFPNMEEDFEDFLEETLHARE